MNKCFLQNFENDISTINEYIKHISLVNEIESRYHDSETNPLKEFCCHTRIFGKDKKIFEYKAIVISLYGILETYINSWIQEHIESLPIVVKNYDDLPEKIKKNNFDLSIRLISLISENKFSKYEHLQKEDILINLNSCLNSHSPYKLNGEAFTPFFGNLKIQKIIDAFKYLDIDLLGCLKINIGFNSFLVKKYGSNIENRKSSELFSIIDDLVARRNDISHGIHVDNILNVKEFYYYIEFLKYFGKAIFEIIIEKEVEYEVTDSFEKIDNIKGVYKKSILCFEVEKNNIKLGDYIIVKINNSFIRKDILEIRVNEKSFEKLNISDKTNIGVNLGNGITINQVFYIKKYNEQG